jgi:type I restriction enzyme, S subunit
VKFGLSEKTIQKINTIFAAHPQVERAVIFGSRAKGNYKNGSDIDLTLHGKDLTLKIQNKIANELDDLLLPYKIDLSIFDQISNPEFVDHILRVGLVFYEKKISGDNKSGGKKKAEGWKVAKLGDVIQQTETINPLQTPNKEFIYIDVSSVNNKTLSIEETSLIKGKDAPSRARKLIKAGDVIFATVRPTLKRIAVIPEEYDRQVCSTGYFVLRGKEFINNKYLFYYLQTDSFNERMEKLQKGASYPAVTDTEVKEQIISYPPLPKQQRIVSVLDEAFASIAQVKSNAERNLVNARELYESILEEVFTNSGHDWEDKKLESVCSEITVGHVASMASKYKPSGIPFLRSQNIRPNSIDLDNVVYIDEQFNSQLKKSQLSPGDVAIVRTGYPGTSAVIPESLPISNCSDLVIVKPGSLVNPYYLCLFFNSTYGKKLVLGNIVGAAQKHFNVTAAKNVSIPVPPLAEQRAIVGRLEALSAETGRLEEIYQQKVESLEELKKSVLGKAFAGEL